MTHVQMHISLDKRGNLGSLRDRHIFAVNEKKKWRSWKEDDRGSYDRSGHCADVTAALGFLDRPECCLFVITKAHVGYGDIQLPSAAHGLLVIGLSYRRDRACALWHHYDIVNLDFLYDLKWNLLPYLCI